MNIGVFCAKTPVRRAIQHQLWMAALVRGLRWGGGRASASAERRLRYNCHALVGA